MELQSLWCLIVQGYLQGNAHLERKDWIVTETGSLRCTPGSLGLV